MRALRLLAHLWTIGLGVVVLATALALAVRLLLPAAGWLAAPTVVAITPTDGETNVLPRSPVTIAFGQPMNRRSVERALRFTPPLRGSMRWNDDGSRLTFTPNEPLASSQSYGVVLAEGVLSRWWRPLAPFEARFRTARAPAVIAALPAASDTPTDTGIALVFSQQMVAPEQVGRPTLLPQLSFTPPIVAEAHWIDSATLLLRPATPLLPNTLYRATVAAGLTDARGAELARPFAWEWRTGGPLLLGRTPAPDERWVAPARPLVLTLSQPLPLDSLRNSLVITPAVAGDLTTTTLLTGTQVITFTPRFGWQPGQSYRVRFDAGRTPAGEEAPSWRFAVEAEPALVGRFPGQNQLLPHGQSLRLVFSVPVDAAALTAGLALDPPAGPLTVNVSETEARVNANLRPSTAYTLTVDAAITSRNGTPLGRAYQVRFLTPPAAPALTVTADTDHLLRLPSAGPQQLRIERTNLSALVLDLYAFDEASLLRALGFSDSQWESFAPERYGLPLLRSWSLPVDDPPDQPAPATLPIALSDGQPLLPGAYYLRLVAAEGPRADLVLLVSPLALTIVQGSSEVLVWATDKAGAAPVAGLPLTLYRGQAVVGRGRTDGDGLWRIPYTQRSGEAQLLVIAGGQLAVARGENALSVGPPSSPATYTALLLSDRTAYQPGDTLHLAGFVRQNPSGAQPGGLPRPGTAVELALIDAQNVAVPLPPATLQARGLVDVTLTIDPNLPPGVYTLRARIGEPIAAIPILLTRPAPVLATTFERDGSRLMLRLTAANAPVAGAQLSWHIRATPLPLPDGLEGFAFGDGPPGEPFTLSGSGVTGAQGLFEVPLPARETLTRTLRLAVEVAVVAPGGLRAHAATLLTLAPPGPAIGIRLPARVVAADEPPGLDLLAPDLADGTTPGATATVMIYRQGLNGDAQLTLRRQVRLDGQGRGQVAPLRLSPGAYTVTAEAGGPRTTTALYVSVPGFSAWPASGEPLPLITDQPRYQPGETAYLLVPVPFEQTTALLALEQGGVLTTTLQRLRAGELLSVPVRPEMAPVTPVAVALAGSEEAPRRGLATLPVDRATAPITVTVEADRLRLLPGSSATLTVTTRIATGAPQAADLLIALYDARDLPWPDNRLTRLFDADAPSDERLLPVLSTLPLRSGAAGVVTTILRLPDNPGNWRVMVYAVAGADGYGQADLTLTTVADLETVVAAPALLRPGDTALLGLTVRNSGSGQRTIRATLNAGGVGVAALTAHETSLPSGGAARFTWIASPTDPPEASLEFAAEAPGEPSRTTTLNLPIAEETFLRSRRATLEVNRPLTVTVVPATPGPGEPLQPASAGARLSVAVAPNIRAATVTAAEQLDRRTIRSVDQEASLVLLSALLGRDGTPSEQAHWREVASRSLERLRLATARSGGWGWWPGDLPVLFVTGYVVEAQLRARAELGLEVALNPDTLRLLETNARDPGRDPDERAYAYYVLALAGQPDNEAMQDLLASDLSADGLAYLALALPTGQVSPLIERLIMLARRDTAASGPLPLVIWQGDQLAGLPHSRIATTALATLALLRDRPANPLIGPALTGLRAAWSVDGWATGIDSVRAAAVLLAADGPQAGAAQPYRLNASGTLYANPSPTTTLRLDLQGQAISGGADLSLSPASPGTGAMPLLLAYRLDEPLPALLPLDRGDGVPTLAIAQDYLDPSGGTPLDPASLNQGQPVRVRLTLVVARPVPLAEVVVHLPGTLALAGASPDEPFLHAVYSPPTAIERPHSLSFTATDLQPGIYTQTFLVYPLAPGTYVAPPALAIPLLEPASAASGTAGRIVVQAP